MRAAGRPVGHHPAGRVGVHPLLALFAALLLLAQLAARPLAAQAPGRGAAPARRNVIIVVADDHRHDYLGFHPAAPAWLETPNLDRMARGGAHLANAFVSTALCSPSRASILSGQYAHRHGVVDNQRDVPAGTVFFPSYLRAAGYRTAMIGKWHMGDDSDRPRPGFDRWVSYRGQGVYTDPVFNVDGRRVARRGYTADLTTDYALDWLEAERRAGRPFFLYLAHKSVHEPFVPAPRHASRYAAAPVPYPATMRPGSDTLGPGGSATWPEWVARQRSSWHGVDYSYHGALDFDRYVRRYAETLLGVDDNLGRLLDYLERTGLARTTLVLYLGDNGFSLGEHGLIDKRHAFEESMRVPMLAWGPGLVRPGARVDALVQNVDLMPTVLEAAGVRAPPGHALDGGSLLALLGDSLGAARAPRRRELLYEYYWEWNFPMTPTQFALRTDRHKYVYAHGEWRGDALYDLAADPGEARNLLGDSAHARLADSLRTRLFERLEATAGMQMPLRRPQGFRADRRRPPGAPSTDPFLRPPAGRGAPARGTLRPDASPAP